MNEYVRKIGIGSPLDQEEYEERDIKVDSDHVNIVAYDAETTEADSLTKKIHDLETDIPDVATAESAGIVKPGNGLQMTEGLEDGTIELAYDHTLTLTNESGTAIGTYDGSEDKIISVATIPTYHASVNNTYGIGDSNKYGHLKITDAYNDASIVTTDSALSSIGANNLYQEVVNKIPQGALVYRGSIVFENIPSSDIKVGDLYNIEEDFTTDSRFQEGAGIDVKAGTDIAWNGLKWDLLAVGGVGELSGLSDVALSSLANQQGLVYNSTSQKWENKDVLLKDGSVAADNLTIGTRASGYTVGTYSFAQGTGTAASGDYAHAEGYSTTASGSASHAEGRNTTTNEIGSHAEGFSVVGGTASVGIYALARGAHVEGCVDDATSFIRAVQRGAHAEGYTNDAGRGILASGYGSHAEGYGTTASGNYSHAEGQNTIASGSGSHAEGGNTTAYGRGSHTEGYSSVVSTASVGIYASGYGAHAEGRCSDSDASIRATGDGAHAEGVSGGSFTPVIASGRGSHAEGFGTQATGLQAHAEGGETLASGSESHAEGYHTIAEYNCNHAQGHWNKSMSSGSEYGTSGNAMVIGNGNTNALSNAFRVTFAGQVYGLSAFNSSGADYAEFFEWEDGNEENEDRVGYFVTLSGDKIKKATAGDYILGIISGQPSVIGNGDEDWLGRWQRDDFGRFIWGDVEVDDPEKEEKVTVKTILPNPDYDPEQKYVERKDRPEWDYVGMLGALAVRDDGTCEVNGFCGVKNGIATKAETGYRVIERVSDNVIRVIFR